MLKDYDGVMLEDRMIIQSCHKVFRQVIVEKKKIKVSYGFDNVKSAKNCNRNLYYEFTQEDLYNQRVIVVE